ncbi:DUF4019 domain-containing protein [Rhodanobacter ginsengiterrae]|uniref:DUF4019 domain-containing protein n=1 Tax=Rhodanobacter ginsengiterrae TaxID=2008451 RepID=UPI003CE9B779
MLARLCLSVLLALPALAFGSSGQAIRVQLRSAGHYELSATFVGTTDAKAAQRLLAPEAAKRCGKQSYSLGHYTFSSSSPVSPGGSEAEPQVTIVQQVICGDSESTDQNRPRQNAGWRPTAADQETVRARTLAYLQDKDRGDFKRALAMVAEPTRDMMANSRWQDSRRTFNAAAGPVQSREVISISWYDHPPEAPPGWYATADYAANYASSAFYCGYVVWLRRPDGSFAMVREDEGKLSPSEAAAIPPERMANVRAQLGCKH